MKTSILNKKLHTSRRILNFCTNCFRLLYKQQQSYKKNLQKNFQNSELKIKLKQRNHTKKKII